MPGGREVPKNKIKKAGREKHLFMVFLTFQAFCLWACGEQNKLTFQDKLIIDPDGCCNITEQDWGFKKLSVDDQRTFKVGETKTLSESQRKHNYFFSVKQSAHLIGFYHLSSFLWLRFVLWYILVH